MEPYYKDPDLTVYLADCREAMRALPENSVHCVVTSPPYWGLRDYKVKKQIGMEKTVAEYLDVMQEVFAEVHRVLRPDGTVWLNLGDTYASTSSGSGHRGLKALSDKYSPRKNPRKNHAYADNKVGQRRGIATGFKAKDLIGIPWRVAFALQDAGWYLRSDIVWAKPNPMPESVKDRPCRSHEYLFLLAKSKRYYYDAEDVKEPASGTSNPRGSGVNPKSELAGFGTRQNPSFSASVRAVISRRNKRTVWTIHPKPFKGAHFATFPPKLVEPCILAGTSHKGCCPTCGANWKRVMENGKPDLAWQRASGSLPNGEYHGTATKDFAAAKAQNASAVKARILAGMVEKKTIGWVQTCSCPTHVPVPCTVLDPFGGAGTTADVAIRLGRKAILTELNPDYVKIILGRCSLGARMPLFATKQAA